MSIENQWWTSYKSENQTNKSANIWTKKAIIPVPKFNVVDLGGRTLCKVDKRPHSLSAAKKQLVRLSGTKYRLKLDHMDKWDKILYLWPLGQETAAEPSRKPHTPIGIHWNPMCMLS